MPKVQLSHSARATSVKPKTGKTAGSTKKDPKVAARAIPGLTARQILKATPRLMINNAQSVHITELREAVTRGGFPAFRAKVSSASSTGKRSDYRVDIIGKEGEEKPLSKQKVMVSCNCENFCYQWEVALNHWGSAKIKYSNGEHPDVTNPGLLPGCCKHCAKLLMYIVKKGW